MYITDELAVSQPAASRHMKVPLDAGRVIASPRPGDVYHRGDEAAIERLEDDLADV